MWIADNPFLYVAALILVSLVAIPLFRYWNRTKNLYDLVLPGWEPVTDSASLFEIESSLTQGPLFTVLGLDSLVVTESHSHLRSGHYFTGMVALHRLVDNHQRSPMPSAGRLHLSERGGRFRYFIAKLSVNAPFPLHIRTKDLGMELEGAYAILKSDLLELERVSGPNGWDLILEKKLLLVITVDLNKTQTNESFVSLCQNMAAKIGG